MSGVELKLHIDRADKRFAFEHIQDVEPILEHNKALRDIPQNSDWGRHVASIPNIVLLQWFNEEYDRGNVGLRMFSKEFDEIVARKLRDPAWKYLRTDK